MAEIECETVQGDIHTQDELITVTSIANTQSACILCMKEVEVQNSARTGICTGCRNVKYCSKTCQKADWPVHKLLCGSFKKFGSEKRPSPAHIRAILFPKDSTTPRFIWIVDNPTNPGQRDYLEFAGDANLSGGCEFKNYNGSPECAATQQLWFIFDIKYPKKADTLNRSILNFGSPGLGYPFCGPVIGCGVQDVDLRDFRAMVDWFVLHPHNKALLDPYRYRNLVVQGVRLNSQSMVKAYNLPELEGISMTPEMVKTSSRMKLTGLSNLFELPIAWHVANDFPGAADPYNNGDPNPSTYIISVSRQLEAHQKAASSDKDVGKAFGDYGTVIISRLDNKPVYALHVEAWHELLFWNSKDIKKATTTASPIESLGKTINKDKFVDYWPGFLLRHQLVDGELDERPNPYDV